MMQRTMSYTKYLSLFIIAGFLFLIPFLTHAAWTELSDNPTSGGAHNWWAMSSSLDGTKVAAVTSMDSGYVAVSSDSGVTWAAASPINYPSNSNRAVAVSGDGSKIYVAVPDVYFGSFFPGQVYVSSNNGVTWATTTGGTHNWTSIVSSGDGSTLFATAGSGQTSYVYTSTDGGATWIDRAPASGTRVFSGPVISSDGTKLAIFGSDVSSNPYIYTSSDGGATWHETTYSFMGTPFISSDGSKIIFLSRHRSDPVNTLLYTSTDNGLTWATSTYENPRLDASYGLLNMTASSDLSRLMAYGVISTSNGGSGYIYTSADGGLTWATSTEVLGLQPWYAMRILSSSRIIAGVGIQGGFIYSSNDFGQTWETNNTHPGRRDWVSVAASSNVMKLAAVAGGTYVFTSTDGGENWTMQTASANPNWVKITSSSDGTKLAAISSGYIYTSTDSGATWTQRTDPGNHAWSDMASSADGNTLIATTRDSGNSYIYTSTDAGATWTQHTELGVLKFDNIGNVAISSNGQIMYAAPYTPFASTTLLYSTDAGATWNTRYVAGMTGGSNYITSSSDGSILAMKMSNAIYRSTNGGVSWTQRGTFPEAVTALQISPNGTNLAVGTLDSYIYTSTNGGRNWSVRTAAGKHRWTSIVAASDNSRIVASVGVDGYIYLGTFSDLVAPSFATVNQTVTDDGVSLSFSTDEVATSTVEVNTLAQTSSSTVASSDSNTTNHTLTVSDLVSCASYGYDLSVADSSENSTSTDNSFTTTGCPGGSTISTSTQSFVDNTVGGSITLDGITLTVPVSFATSSAAFQVNKLDSGSIVSSFGSPSSEKQVIDPYVYNLIALPSATTTVSSFNQPLTITLSYDPADIPSGVDPSSLTIYRHDDGQPWVALTCTVDTDAHTVTCPTNHFSVFTLFGDTPPVTSRRPTSHSAAASLSSTSPVADVNPTIEALRRTLISTIRQLIVLLLEEIEKQKTQ